MLKIYKYKCCSIFSGFKYLSLITFFILSCSSSSYSQESNVKYGPVSWFKAGYEHFLFKTNIEILNKKYSGLLVVRETRYDTFRVVMLSEVGLKIFDFELIPDSGLRVHYIMDAINKKALTRTLSNDLGIILMNNLSNKQFEIVSRKNESNIIFKYNIEGRRLFYFVNKDNLKPYFIKQKGLIMNKVKAHLYGDASSDIDSVRIRHNSIRFLINLQRIKEESSHVIN